MKVSTLLLLAGVLIVGCAGARMVARPVLTSAYRPAVLTHAADDLDYDSLLQAARLTRDYFARVKTQSVYRLGRGTVTTSDLADSAARVVQILESSTARNAAGRLARECDAYIASPRARFTAYYEPLLAASRERDERFRYPLYRAPDTLTLAMLAGSSDEQGKVPYPTREQIDGEGVLAGKGLELAWVDDPVALYFLHVQGSGRLAMRDGTTMRVGYAASNERPYHSIGRYMIDSGIVGPGKGSSAGIRAYLRAHPESRNEILFRNPRYIFFREIQVNDGEGPLGSLGVPLVAGRSLATDKEHVPPGILAYIETNKPVSDADGRLIGWAPLARFAFSHDVGAAITGESRADIYWGSGEHAGAEAGYLNLPGNLYLLLCRRGSVKVAAERRIGR